MNTKKDCCRAHSSHMCGKVCQETHIYCTDNTKKEWLVTDPQKFSPEEISCTETCYHQLACPNSPVSQGKEPTKRNMPVRAQDFQRSGTPFTEKSLSEFREKFTMNIRPDVRVFSPNVLLEHAEYWLSAKLEEAQKLTAKPPND